MHEPINLARLRELRDGPERVDGATSRPRPLYHVELTTEQLEGAIGRAADRAYDDGYRVGGMHAHDTARHATFEEVTRELTSWAATWLQALEETLVREFEAERSEDTVHVLALAHTALNDVAALAGRRWGVTTAEPFALAPRDTEAIPEDEREPDPGPTPADRQRWTGHPAYMGAVAPVHDDLDAQRAKQNAELENAREADRPDDAA